MRLKANCLQRALGFNKLVQAQQAGFCQQSCRGGTDHASRSGYHSRARGGPSSSPSTCKCAVHYLQHLITPLAAAATPRPRTTSGPLPNLLKKSFSRWSRRPAANWPLPLMRKLVGSGVRSEVRNASHSPSGTIVCGGGQPQQFFWYCPLLPADTFSHKETPKGTCVL